MFVYLQITGKLRNYELEKDYQNLQQENKANNQRLLDTLKELNILQQEKSRLPLKDESKDEFTYTAKRAKINTVSQAKIDEVISKVMSKYDPNDNKTD